MPERLIRRTVQLLLGLFLFGIGISLMVLASLGTAPWDVLALGIITHLPLSFGLVTVLVSILVLLCWIPLRERPGIGTVLNALLIGPAADFGLLVLPDPTALWARIIYLVGGVVLVGLASGLYIGARFGPGPRDGLMTGLHRVTGRPIWVVRTCLEVTVVLIGWLLGGTVGFGTVLFALAIGPLCQLFLRILTVPLARDSIDESDGAASD
jgi:uncharacterized membrane protein YczE